MIPIRLSELARVVDGELATPAHGDVVVSGPAFLDTRTPEPGGLFVAIAGERVDGHDFVERALEGGARAVLGSRPTVAPTVLVADATQALARLARHQLDQLDQVCVYAITGSQGKTGTKDYLAQVLSVDGTTVATRANHNNELGVPLTVLQATRETRHLVVEMGARGVGHIDHLTRIAPPQVAAVLNVGTSHIGEFGGQPAIARAKGEIVEALGAQGRAVLYADDRLVAEMASRTEAPVLTFGAEGADVWYSAVTHDALGRARFTLHHGARQAEVTLRQVGGHQVVNATAAAAMALAGGMDLSRIAAALASAEAASPMRMHLSERADGLLVINDAYNANPESTIAALSSLAQIARPGRRIAVLGEMLELGDTRAEAHRRVGRQAAAEVLDVLIGVGEAGALIVEGARSVPDWAGESHVTASRDEAAAWVRHNVCGDDVVLVKASRGVALEYVAEALLVEGTPTQ